QAAPLLRTQQVIVLTKRACRNLEQSPTVDERCAEVAHQVQLSVYRIERGGVVKPERELGLRPVRGPHPPGQDPRRRVRANSLDGGKPRDDRWTLIAHQNLTGASFVRNVAVRDLQTAQQCRAKGSTWQCKRSGPLRITLLSTSRNFFCGRSLECGSS